MSLRTSDGISAALEFAVVFERTTNNYAVYVPDLPGCISTDKTRSGIESMIREAIGLHLEALLECCGQLPTRRMSLAEASAYHHKNLSEADSVRRELGEFAPTLSTEFGIVDVEIAANRSELGD